MEYLNKVLGIEVAYEDLQERCSAEKRQGKKYFHRRRCFYCISFMEAHRNYLQVKPRRTWN